MLLSILIPSVPSRNDKMVTLFNKLSEQVGSAPVEILCFVDNKRRSIGGKRDSLVQIANGDYLTFVDDDDDIKPDYVNEILKAVRNHNDADVICFKISASMNGQNTFIVDHDPHYENEEARIVAGKWVDVKRKPLHNSVWKSSLAKSESFPDSSYGEDGTWAAKLHPKIKTVHKIDKVLSHYSYDANVTEAPKVI